MAELAVKEPCEFCEDEAYRSGRIFTKAGKVLHFCSEMCKTDYFDNFVSLPI